jgi:DNA-directed RNA polymerase subunit RPC12/RpoP
MAELGELTCPNCGAILQPVEEADQAACPCCRTKLLIERKAVPAPPEAEPLACPLCGNADGIQKVSTIYVSEISRGYRGGLWGTRQTGLSRLLSPPTKPRSSDPRAQSIFKLGVMLCGLAVYSGICFFGGPALRVPPSELTLIGMSLGVTAAAIYSTLIAGATIIVGVPLIVGAVLVYRGHKRIRAWEERLSFERGRWERARRRWERMYYCARDDGVFIPGDTPVIPILQLRSYLYGE